MLAQASSPRTFFSRNLCCPLNAPVAQYALKRSCLGGMQGHLLCPAHKEAREPTPQDKLASGLRASLEPTLVGVVGPSPPERSGLL